MWQKQTEIHFRKLETTQASKNQINFLFSFLALILRTRKKVLQNEKKDGTTKYEKRAYN